MTNAVEGACKRARTDAGEKVQGSAKAVYEDANGVPKSEGRVTHLGLTDGELANKVVVVGHISRAELLSSFLTPEHGDKIFSLTSHRGFTTYTGLFEGHRVSVVATGMGMAMMDFFVREARSVVSGPMLIVRFGTCGTPQQQVKLGSVSVATEGSICIQRNFAAFSPGSDGKDSYLISAPCPSDAVLSENLVKTLKTELGEDTIIGGLNATADSFYCSQGRKDPCFKDDNDGIIEGVVKMHPSLTTIEMETYHLLHMAQCSQPTGSIRAAAVAVPLANRATAEVIDAAELKVLERDGGRAILKALVASS